LGDPAGEEWLLRGASRAVGVIGGVGGLGQDVEAGEQAEGLIGVEIADRTASPLIESLQRQEAEQGVGGGHHPRAGIAGVVDDRVEAQACQRGQEPEDSGDSRPEASSGGEFQFSAVGHRRGPGADG
jgi:hypothetical protein